MTAIEEALAYDAVDQPMKAAEAYERAIAEPQSDIEVYLNLAVLYFVCNDPGYFAHKKLPTDFIQRASERAFEILDEAEKRSGGNPDVHFWRMYFRFILLCDPPFYPQCKTLVETGTSLTPYLHLVGSPEGEQYRSGAEALLTLVKDGATARARYVRSVLESAMKHRRSNRV